MVTFSCLEGDAVEIGDEITITVLRVDGDNVVLEVHLPEGFDVQAAEQLCLPVGSES
jgi:sRNA-binding carbon storage regulator CsrA